MITSVVVISVILLGIAALLLLHRMVIGPTVLDRAVAFDVIVALTLIGVALDAAVRRTDDTLPILVVLSMIGFLGSVAIARFGNPRDVDGSPEDESPDPRGGGS